MSDTRTMKEDTRLQWDTAAAGWDRHAPAIRAWLRLPTAAMIAMAGVRPDMRVLDVAAGAGDQTLDLAAVVGPGGYVLATDISGAILAHAVKNAAAAGHLNVGTMVTDAEALEVPEESFDAAVCRLGLMFLPHPRAALVRIRRTLRPGARFCAMVFAGPEANPCLRTLMSTALRHAGLPPRDPFHPGGLMSLGQPGDLDGHFRAAGFDRVATTSMDAPFCLPTTADYMAFVKDAAGPILQILARLAPPKQVEAWADIATQLDAYQGDAMWVGPNRLFLTVGQA